MANWWGNSGKSQLMRRVDSLEKTLMLGGIGGRRGRVWQRMRWLVGITDSMDAVWVNSGSWWGTWRPGMLWFMGSQRVGHDWVTELNWKSLLLKVKEERGKSCLKTQHSKNEDHGIWSHHFMANRWGKNANSDGLCFLRFQSHCGWWLQPWN